MFRNKPKTTKNKNDNKFLKGFSLAFVLSLIILTFSAFVITDTPNVSAAWMYDTFEDNISVDFRPKIPNNNEPVNITIIGKSQQIIKGANLHYNYSVFGYERAGGVVFSPIPENPYALFVVIPGYPGSTIVHFYIEAWDVQNEVLISPEFTYIVAMNNSWKYSTFEENIDVNYAPQSPGPKDKVVITVESRDNEIPIVNTEVFFMLKPKDGSWDGPYNDFSIKLDDITWENTINEYPAGTEISFWVEAYDFYGTEMVSEKYNYTVKTPDPGEIIVEAKLWILVADKTGEKIPNVNVNIRNSSWSEDFKTDEQGLLLTPFLRNDRYIVTIDYLNKVEVADIVVPNAEENYTVAFVVDKAKLLSELHGIEDFPQWYVWGAFVVVLLILPLLFLYVRERLKEEPSKKKRERIYKVMERPTEASVLDPILTPIKPILKLFEEEPKRIKISKFLAFFALGLLGVSWAPFYPWWLIVILGFSTGSLSLRFPYLSLIILSLFVLAATAYQAPEFGLMFLIFSLIILVVSFFNWKFGYLVFLTVFLSRLGIMMFVPVAAAMLYSVILGIAVIVISGIFMSFFVTCGNLTNLSFLIGPPHKSAFIIFNKSAPSEFLPVHFVDALGSINSPNLELMNSIFRSNYNSMVPIIQVVIWALVIYFIYFITEKYFEKNFIRYISLIIVPLAFFPISALAAIYYFDYSLDAQVLVLSFAMLGIGLAGVLTSFTIQELYPSLFKKEIERDTVGTRISQLMSLRKASFKSVGGLEETKRELKTSITIPLLKPKLSKLYGVNPPKGVMLFGPPGCGKTLIMRALASELNVEMISIKCSDIMSKWYGESEEMTSRMFEVAKSRAPCILFLDEVDAVAKRRSFYSTDDVTPRLLSIMLNELDGMDESAGIMVVGATNMPELIDPALMRPGRFDKIIYIPPPDFEARKDIFKIYLKNKPLARGVNYYELAGRTDGYSGADIENIVKEASMHAMRKTLETRRRAYITMDDFDAILNEIKPSVSKKMQKEFDKLGFDYSRKVEKPSAKKKTRKSNGMKKKRAKAEEEDSGGVIEMDEGDISWEDRKEEEYEEEDTEAETETEEEEAQVWDKYVPKKSTKIDEDDDDIFFEPISVDEDEVVSKKGRYKTKLSEEFDSEDDWM